MASESRAPSRDYLEYRNRRLEELERVPKEDNIKYIIQMELDSKYNEERGIVTETPEVYRATRMAYLNKLDINTINVMRLSHEEGALQPVNYSSFENQRSANRNTKKGVKNIQRKQRDANLKLRDIENVPGNKYLLIT
jgi:hypothetical protein